MLKKLVVLLACFGAIQLSSCTSKDSKEDGGDEIAIDAAAESAEVEKVEGEQSLDIAAEDSSASLSGDALPEDALGEAPPTDAPPVADAPMMDAPPTDVAASEPPPVEETLPPDALGDAGSTVETAPPVVENTEPVQETSSATTEVAEAPKESKPMPSYRKVETAPWKEGGKVLNTVYVARDGDSWASVSQMIYGSEKVSDLKKMNPAIKGRKMKVGDKVYYNSPHRPDDETKVLTYYEDSGIAPEVYIAKAGDTAKSVAKELFGSEQGWKELYATNDFESKGKLDEGTQIKYWRTAAAVTKPAEVAAAQPAEMAPPAPPADMPPPPTADMPPPPPPADMAPPPPPPDMASNEMAPPPPPPPPVEAVAPPPPPPMDMAKKNMGDAGAPMEEDQMTTLAAGAVVAVGLALFMIMRRRRKKELEQAIQDTQVG
ncbi:hypothetical protein [Bdellovibrio sp. HCB337]|uniref:hypothetical protein n=1 Tax=Bdellovibrio sp. HCB337 TaxID=3394358 RepID=UPI0039A5B0E4